MFGNLLSNYIYYIRRLFLSYHLPGKSFASSENKNQKHNSNVRISKHVKLHVNLPQARQL